MQTQGNLWGYAREGSTKGTTKESREISVTIVFQGTSSTGHNKHRKKKNVVSRMRANKSLKKPIYDMDRDNKTLEKKRKQNSYPSR